MHELIERDQPGLGPLGGVRSWQLRSAATHKGPRKVRWCWWKPEGRLGLVGVAGMHGNLAGAFERLLAFVMPPPWNMCAMWSCRVCTRQPCRLRRSPCCECVGMSRLRVATAWLWLASMAFRRAERHGFEHLRFMLKVLCPFKWLQNIDTTKSHILSSRSN